ncbi:MAG: class I SAM-dependent methyltransferase [Pseudomonadales bacterium]|nr:class I SAM-dependent methyltransferase [Pseudomonadales bacterium]
MSTNTLPSPALKDSHSAKVSTTMAARLVHHLLGNIRTGSLALVNRQQQLTFGTDPTLNVTVNIHADAVYNKILQGGAIGAAEAYMDGDWTTDNLTDLIRLMLRNRSLLEQMQSRMSWLRRVAHGLYHRSRRDTVTGSKRNIADHYDLGNGFFQLFLDPTMMYSSGVFKHVTDSMEQASTNKLDIICQKLQLTPDDHLLEIGTGWGGLSHHAALHYGCRVTTTTISEEQHQYAARQIAEAGLGERVTLLKKDYRHLTGTYDKLVSVEMIEAVGLENLPVFFEKCASLLKPEGQMLLQSITIADQRYEAASNSVDFIQRYIFPGGALPSVTALLKTATEATDLRSFALEDITEHYAETLHRWRKAFLKALPEARQMGFDNHFIRMWDYYLAYCEGGFLERAIGCIHVQFHKPGFRRTLT